MDDLKFFENLKKQHTLIQNDDDGNHIIERLNRLINGDKQSRHLALCILNVVLKKCNQELLEENSTTWMRFLLQLLNSIPYDDLLKLCFITLRQLLEHASHLDKCARDIATKGIDPLLALLVGTSLPLSAEKLDIIRCCLKTFPGPCGQHRSGIMKLVIFVIESDKFDHIAACKLYALLPRCGSAGEKEKKYAENWQNQFNQLVNTIHFYLAKLNIKLSDLVEKTSDVETKSTKFVPFCEINDGLELDSSKMLVKIEKLLLMMKYFVSTPLSFEVSFPMLKLINLFCDVSNLRHLELKDFKYALIGQRINDVLLLSVSVTIQQFKTLLLPFIQPIMQIIIPSISSSRVVYRTVVYQCVSNVFEHLKISPENLSTIDDVLPSIFKDIRIQCDTSYLDSGAQTSQLNEISSQTVHTSEKRKKNVNQLNCVSIENAYAALKVLEKILKLNGAVMSVSNLRSIISNVLNIFVKLYGKDEFQSPYSCDNNRLNLFKVSKALLTLQHGSINIPVAIFLSYFTVGSTETHNSIKSYCCTVLLEYDCILHPLNHTFYDKRFIEIDVYGDNSEPPPSLDEKFVEDKGEIKKEEDIFQSNNGGFIPSQPFNNGGFIQSHPSNNCGFIQSQPSQQSIEVSGVSQIESVSNGVQSFPLSQQFCKSTDVALSGVTEHSDFAVSQHSNSQNQNNTMLSDECHANKPGVPIYMFSERNSIAIQNCNDLDMNGQVYNESDIKTDDDDDDDDGTVVISDNSSEEDIAYVQTKFEAAPQTHITRDGSADVLENIYSPKTKKAKLNDDIDKYDGDKCFEDDGDDEYVRILDTFCEIDPDD